MEDTVFTSTVHAVNTALYLPYCDLCLAGLGECPGEHGPEVGRAGGQYDLVGKDFPAAHRDHHVAEVVQLPYQVQLRQRGSRNIPGNSLSYDQRILESTQDGFSELAMLKNKIVTNSNQCSHEVLSGIKYRYRACCFVTLQ